MGTYIDTAIRQDEWYLHLDREARHLFNDLVMYCEKSIAGIFILTMGKIIDMGYTQQEIEILFEAIEEKVSYDKKTGYVWIKNYLKHYSPTNRIVTNIAKNISKTLQHCKIYQDEFLLKYEYLLEQHKAEFAWYNHNSTLPLPKGVKKGGSPTPFRNRNRNRLKIKGNNKELLNWFDKEFYTIYLKKVGRAEAEKAIVKLNPDDELKALMIEKLKLLNEQDYKFREKSKIPNASTWINNSRWNDEPIPPDKKPIEQQPVEPSYMQSDEYKKRLASVKNKSAQQLEDEWMAVHPEKVKQ